MTDTVMEAMSTMMENIQSLSFGVYACCSWLARSLHAFVSILPVDPSRALARGVCSAEGCKLHLTVACITSTSDLREHTCAIMPWLRTHAFGKVLEDTPR